MLIKDSETWKRIIREGKGYIYNDFGTQFHGDAPTWNTREFNKLHRVSCAHVKKMTYITEGKLTKYFFKSEEEAIEWLEKNRKKEGYTLCPCTRIIPDSLDMKHEYLFRIIGRERKYSLATKCLLLILILCIPCLVTNSLGGIQTLVNYFVRGWGHFFTTVFSGVFMWFLIRFIRKMDEKIRLATQIITPPAGKIQEYANSWHVSGTTSHRWYYFQALGGAACGFILGMILIGPEHSWVQGNLFRELYLRAWFVFYGFFVGASLYYIWGGFWTIREYCRIVVSDEEILPLDPDRTGGLRELGRLSLDLDLIAALPSVAFPIYLLGNPAFSEIAIILSVLYAAFLVFVFFVSISPAHDDMVKAKANYLLKIHKEYKDMHKELVDKLDTKERIETKEYKKLSGLYALYDRVEKMAVWPLDFRTALRFAATSLLPLISVGITIQFGL